MGESNGNGNGKSNSKHPDKPWLFTSETAPRNGGRPKRASLRIAYLRALAREIPDDPDSRAYVDAVAEAILSKALAGDVKAAKELRETTLGSRLNIKQRTTILPVEQDQIAIDRESTLADLAGRSIGNPPLNGSNGNGSRGSSGG